MKLAPMTKKNPIRTGFGPLLLGLLLLTAEISVAQENARSQYIQKFQNGAKFYRELRWFEAAAEFRYAQETASNSNDWAQALYWVILAELAIADYGSALRDMDELEKTAPNSVYTRDMVYHRARVYFNQGYFEDALVLFKRFNDSIPSENTETADVKAAAFFWIGECLYSIGQFEEAEKFYAWVITKYPNSPKVEISSYRMDLIKQKKIEAELLALLRWSHEESLRTSEDYQRKIKTYEHTLNTYQRRIAELTQGSGYIPERTAPADTGNSNGVYNLLPPAPMPVAPPVAPALVVPAPVTPAPVAPPTAPAPAVPAPVAPPATPEPSAPVDSYQSKSEAEVSIAAAEDFLSLLNNTADGNGLDNGTNDYLIEKAKQLRDDLQKLIKEHNGSGGTR